MRSLLLQGKYRPQLWGVCGGVAKIDAVEPISPKYTL